MTTISQRRRRREAWALTAAGVWAIGTALMMGNVLLWCLGFASLVYMPWWIGAGILGSGAAFAFGYDIQTGDLRRR